MGRSVAARKSGGADRIEPGSRRSKPAMVWRTSAASLTVRVMGTWLSEEVGRWRSGNAGVSGYASEGWFDGVCSAEV